MGRDFGAASLTKRIQGPSARRTGAGAVHADGHDLKEFVSRTIIGRPGKRVRGSSIERDLIVLALVGLAYIVAALTIAKSDVSNCLTAPAGLQLGGAILLEGCPAVSTSKR